MEGFRAATWNKKVNKMASEIKRERDTWKNNFMRTLGIKKKLFEDTAEAFIKE